MSTELRPPSFRRSLMQVSISMLALTALGIAACGGGGGGDATAGLGGGRPLESSQSASPEGSATVLGAALNAPWGFAFLPDGRMVVTERAGTMALVDAGGGSLIRLSGVPAVAYTPDGQGGLLDVAYDNGWVYFTFSEAGSNGSSGTALARAQINGAALQNLAVIWRQTPKVTSSVHYGARIAFRGDGTLYLAVGERGVENTSGNARTDAQGVQRSDNSIGKVLRLNADGSPAPGNPSLGSGAVAGTLWSTGHRNPQGAAVRPQTNELWLTEHGPQGGDELNRVEAGANYGWPTRSYGCPYDASNIGDGCRIGGGTHAPDFTEPKTIWVPTSTAPSGLMWYDGDAFPQWQGNLFAGALGGSTLWRIVVNGDGNATSRHEVAVVKNLGVRVRDVRQGPDGNIYLLTNGSGGNANRIVRLAP